MSQDDTTRDERPLFDAVTNLVEFFQEELNEACDRLGLELTQETEAYLVHLLEGYTRVTPERSAELGFHRPAAFMLGDAVFGAPGERVEAYRKLGDACLYNCGFFDARLTRRSVSASYYQRMGRDAYDNASTLMRSHGGGRAFATIFDELAEKFDGFVAAFRRLARRTDAHDDAMALIQRWRRGEAVDLGRLVMIGKKGRG